MSLMWYGTKYCLRSWISPYLDMALVSSFPGFKGCIPLKWYYFLYYQRVLLGLNLNLVLTHLVIIPTLLIYQKSCCVHMRVTTSILRYVVKNMRFDFVAKFLYLSLLLRKFKISKYVYCVSPYSKITETLFVDHITQPWFWPVELQLLVYTIQLVEVNY